MTQTGKQRRDSTGNQSQNSVERPVSIRSTMNSFRLNRDKIVAKLRRNKTPSNAPGSPTLNDQHITSATTPTASIKGGTSITGEYQNSSSLTVSSSCAALTPGTETNVDVDHHHQHDEASQRKEARQPPILAVDTDALATPVKPITTTTAASTTTTTSNTTTASPTEPGKAAGHFAAQEYSRRRVSQDLAAAVRATTATSSQQLQQPNSRPTPKTPQRPVPIRRQSLLPANQTGLIRTLLEPDYSRSTPISPQQAGTVTPSADFAAGAAAYFDSHMIVRKVWVKRPGGSPTLVPVTEEDLVDDFREAILKKYTNALGRNYDAPDLTLRIIPRGGASRPRSHSSHDNLHMLSSQFTERQLQPDELVVRTLDEYFPGGQSASEALIIEIPNSNNRRLQPPLPARDPRESPGYQGLPTSAVDHETGDGDYFGTYVNSGPHSSSSQHPPVLPSMPASPDPRRIVARPRQSRTTTASPTTFQNNVQDVRKTIILRPRAKKLPSTIEDTLVPDPPGQTILSPTELSGVETPIQLSVPTKKVKSPVEKAVSSTVGLPGGAVPPINVLIVEDNVINLRLLEAFMKRLKVRWQIAMNGRAAVEKWRQGGFHLVLMDIQLPIMSGLEATKEIRRLESVNGIGVLAGGLEDKEEEQELKEEDKLPRTDELFKSPVIIVALTASSLMSDRNEALAAGCNDFLTKPVGFIFLERKVTEWGCMQALIDFDGWRKWKFQQGPESQKAQQQKQVPAREASRSPPAALMGGNKNTGDDGDDLDGE